MDGCFIGFIDKIWFIIRVNIIKDYYFYISMLKEYIWNMINYYINLLNMTLIYMTTTKKMTK